MNILWTHLFCIVLFLTAGLRLSAQTTDKQLYILHTSDTHSRIEPLDTHIDDPQAGLGGIVRRATFVKEFRRKHPDLLLLDCGDISQGTPYYNIYHGEVEIKAMNLMGYDAMALGNHEFDYGMDNMARLFRMARFPVLCANYDFTGTVLEDVVRPYAVIERQGLRIGLFGLSPQPEGLIQADKCTGVVYKDPIMTARNMVEQLRGKEHCDVVICLSHLGISPGSDGRDAIYDNNLVGLTRGIDLILGGHTHTYMTTPEFYQNADGEKIPIMHVGKDGTYAGVLTLKLEAHTN